MRQYRDYIMCSNGEEDWTFMMQFDTYKSRSDPGDLRRSITF